MKHLLTILLVILIAQLSYSQEWQKLSFVNKCCEVPQGGHLQGIQMLETDSANYYYLSSSSNKFAWLGTVKEVDGEAELIRIDTITGMPYPHAGGIQLNGEYLLVGVEDNSDKDKSIVQSYRIDDPERPLEHPKWHIDRSGEYKLMTAGAVGLFNIHSIPLIAVACWDAMTIDFFIRTKLTPDTEDIVQIDSWNPDEEGAKDEWSDDTYASYQSINFFTSGENLFLAGFTAEGKSEIMDIFQVKIDWHTDEVSLVKTERKTFDIPGKGSFLKGGGLYQSIDGIRLLATENKISKKGAIYFLDTSPTFFRKK